MPLLLRYFVITVLFPANVHLRGREPDVRVHVERRECIRDRRGGYVRCLGCRFWRREREPNPEFVVAIRIVTILLGTDCIHAGLPVAREGIVAVPRRRDRPSRHPAPACRPGHDQPSTAVAPSLRPSPAHRQTRANHPSRPARLRDTQPPASAPPVADA